MFGKHLNVRHAGCEVWNEEESRWRYMDADRQMVDFPREDFICGSDAWLMLRRGDIRAAKYKSVFFVGEQSIPDCLRLDLLCVLLEEPIYWGGPPFGPPETPELDDLLMEELRTLGRIVEMMEHPGSHIEELRLLRNRVNYL